MNAVRKLSENSFVQMENGTGHKIKNKTKIENNNISDSSLFFFFSRKLVLVFVQSQNQVKFTNVDTEPMPISVTSFPSQNTLT